MHILGFIFSYSLFFCTLLAEPSEALLAHAQIIAASPEIDHAIKKGEALMAHFNTPEFLEPFINAEAYNAKKQQAWNDELITPISPAYGNHIPAFGLYKADCMRTGILAATWLLEWYLYKHITEELTSIYIAEWRTDTESLKVPFKKITLPPRKVCTSSLVKIILLYSTGIVMLQQAYAHYRLAAPSLKQDPKAISELLRGPCTTVLDIINPQHLTATINSYFISLGLLDARTNALWMLISKECIVQCSWLYYYLTTVVAERISTSIAPYAAILPDALNTVDDITTILHKRLHPSFMTWTSKKIIFSPIGHAACNVIIATPALYNIGQNLYATFNSLNQSINKESDAQAS